eukprot:2412256-Pleurochrysis_carterae.AAC.3
MPSSVWRCFSVASVKVGSPFASWLQVVEERDALRDHLSRSSIQVETLRDELRASSEREVEACAAAEAGEAAMADAEAQRTQLRLEREQASACALSGSVSAASCVFFDCHKRRTRATPRNAARRRAGACKSERLSAR